MEVWKKYLVIAISGLSIGFFMGWLLLGLGAKKGAIEWEYGNSKLKIDVEKDLEGPDVLLKKIFSAPFSKDGALGWLKKEHKVFSIGDMDITEEIQKLNIENPLSRRLREISEKRKGPWAYQIAEVSIGIPPHKLQPDKGYANVCESGDYLRQKVELTNPKSDKRINVVATGKYSCPPDYEYPDMQLNADDAKELFGGVVFDKTQKAKALILP